MSEAPKLSLPEGKPVVRSLHPALSILLVATLVVSAASASFMTFAIVRPRMVAANEQMALALQLEQQLPRAAAEAWLEYLAQANPSAARRANLWYRIGMLYQDLGDYEPALASYYRSELAADVGIGTELQHRIAECLAALGKLAALRQVRKERVAVEQGQGQSAVEVLAQIGSQRISAVDLDQRIEEQIELQLATYVGYLTPEQLKQQKEALFKQYATAERRRQILEQLVIQEILHRAAREERVHELPATRAMLTDAEQQILAQQLLAKKLTERIQISETDLRTYYDANLKDYLQEPRAYVDYVSFDDEEQARRALDSIDRGMTLEDLVTSRIAAAKSDPVWVQKGSQITGIGPSDEATIAIFSTRSGQVADAIVASEHGFYLIRVIERQPQRQMSYEEVRNNVNRDLYERKAQEVQSLLIEQLKDKYDVVVYPNKLTNPQSPEP